MKISCAVLWKQQSCPPADKVLEVGPGIGTLTQGLAESGADVVAVELDKRLLPVLDVTLEGYDNVRIVNGDILQVNIMETVAAPEFKVCANLPYYITTPIIFALLEKRLPMERLVAMVQKDGKCIQVIAGRRIHSTA